MKTYTRGTGSPPPLERPVVTLGNFDGVHRGHRYVIERTLERARATSLPALLVTFSPHPLKVIRPDSAPPLLTSDEEKLTRIATLGIGHALVIPFTAEFARIPAETFASQVLHRELGASSVFVGNNFNFGQGREGNVEVLRRLGQELGFDVPDLPDFRILGSPVSSSRIRRAIGSGEVELARELLGRPYSLRGEVVRGDARGASLGYPTANLRSTAELYPADGVYVTLARLEGREFPSVTNVGRRPTFSGASFAVETHLLEGPGDLYDRKLEIEFLARLRPEVRFASVELLRRQIAADVARARRYFEDSISRAER